MLLKIRKLQTGIMLMVSALALSSCLMDMEEPPPTVAISQITTQGASPDSPLLYCRAGRGAALFGREWQDFSDTSFELQRGYTTDIDIISARDGRQFKVRGYFDASGQKVIFCPFINAPAGQKVSCASLYALDEDLREGIKRTFDIPAVLRGGAITCAYDQKNLRMLSVPGAGGY
jgi:hypothetical protein